MGPLVEMVKLFCLPEFLDLTIDEVGRCIELVYTHVRKDGMKGNPKSILFDVITPDELIFIVKNLAKVFVSFLFFYRTCLC